MAGLRFIDIVTDAEEVTQVRSLREFVKRQANISLAMVCGLWECPFLWTTDWFQTIAEYATGTVAVTTGLATITGTGTTFTATLAQYGAVNTFSDILEAIGPSSFMEQPSHIFGIQGALTIETLIYNELVSGASAFYANGTSAGSKQGPMV
jgi:hypothetical protein